MKRSKRRVREILEVTGLRKKYDKEKGKFVIDVRYRTRSLWTERTEGVAEAFGIGLGEEEERVIYDNLELEIGPRDIVYITGESGGGKSVLLRALAEDLGDEALDMAEVEVEEDRPIIDTVGRTLREGLSLLSRVGLNDAYLLLRPYNQLSEGQRYRYRLAKLMESGAQYWVMDEFCSTLDRTTARIVAFNVQKQARRMGRGVLAATAHEDLLQDLAPSVYVKKGLGRRLEVRYFPNRPRERCSVAEEVRVERGTPSDYRELAEFHYRSHRLPPPIAIYAMRRGEELVGVIVYSYPGINSFGRRRALGRRVPVEELNRDFAVISRVVLHPRYRSIGLGRRIVEKTLPLVGRRYVEAIAVMAQYNPFFEKAGMRRVAEIGPDESLLEVGERLRRLGFNPIEMASEEANLRRLEGMGREEVEECRRILMGVSPGYYKRLKPSRRAHVGRGEFRSYVEGAPLRRLARMLRTVAVLLQTKVYLIWENPDLREGGEGE